MHLVATAAGEGFDQPHHVDTRLQRVVGADQPHVAPPHHEQLLGAAHLVAVHQSLEGACAVDPGQVAAGKGEPLLSGPAGDQNHLGCDEAVLSLTGHAELTVMEDADDGGVQPDLDRGQLRYLVVQHVTDVDTPHAGVAVGHRTEEVVGLQGELTTQLLLVVHDQDADAQLPQLDGGADAGRTTADDQDLDREILHRGRTLLRRGIAQLRQALAALNLHARLDRRHARFDRPSIRNHGALRALPVDTEDALGTAVFLVVAEDTDPRGVEGRGDDLAPARFQSPVVEAELDVGLRQRRQDGMGGDATRAGPVILHEEISPATPRTVSVKARKGSP